MSSIRPKQGAPQEYPAGKEFVISVFRFNKLSGLWEEGSLKDTELKTAAFVKESFFAKLEPGDTVQITAKGTQKLTERGFVQTKETPLKVEEGVKVTVKVRTSDSFKKEVARIEAQKITRLSQAHIEAAPPVVALKPLAQGKVKQVSTSEEHPENVFFSALPGWFKWARERELKTEVNTASDIREGIIKMNLTRFCREAFEDRANTLLTKIFNRLSSKDLINIMDLSIKSLAKKAGISQQDAAIILAADKNEMLKGREHLAVELDEVAHDKGYLVKTNKAVGDLDGEFKKQKAPPPLATKMRYASEFLEGMYWLHKSGHVHGDMKPDNCLIVKDKNGEKHIKISDFGKARPLQDKETGLHLGNLRFNAPEGELSKAAEVYSSALMTIWILERGLLDKTGMLIEPSEVDPQAQPRSDRTGIEKFVVTSNKLPNIDATGSLRGKVTSLFQRVELGVQALGVPSSRRTPEQLKEAEKEIHSYIDALTKRLAPQIKNETKVQQISALLKWMTNADPSKRPTMDTVMQSLSVIGF